MSSLSFRLATHIEKQLKQHQLALGQYPLFEKKTFQTFQSPLEVVLSSFPLMTSAMQLAETAPQVARRLEEIKGTTISNQTVRNVFKRAGLKAVGKKKQPYLKPGHHRARMDFAKKY